MRRSGHHVLLAVPTRGSVRWETITRLEEIRDQTPGLRPILYQSGNLNVALTRNRIVKNFLASDCQVLVMVDDDIVPPPTMMETLTRLCPVEADVVAIPHMMPHPQQKSRLVLTAFTDQRPVDLHEGLNAVDWVATGCIAISRRVFHELGRTPFRISSDPEAAVASDDFLFCDDVRERGFSIYSWWDGWPCDHVTTVSLGPIYERSASEYA